MIAALLLYFVILTVLVAWSSRGIRSNADFVIGNRSLNFWLTAMAAHASDMSSWLFMGYPALIFIGGLFNVWVAVGLVICMWLNWELVAKKLRVLTGQWNCSTFSSFLHHRYEDKSGLLQISSAIFCFIFYIVYICSGLTGIGILGESLFGISYSLSILIAACIVVLYVTIGGFIGLAWVDFTQGMFLLTVLCLTPIFIVNQHVGTETFFSSLTSNPSILKWFPTSIAEAISVVVMALGWGLGYFGQPHIVTKFMGIKSSEEISKSRNFGMGWMVLSLAAATAVGLVGISFFASGLGDPQMVFVEMVKRSFSPFLAGLILCAVIAATINVMSAQLLILGSIVNEDVCRRFFAQKLTSKHLLYISRLGIVFAAIFAYIIAYFKISSIYHLVHYAWSGLGASFGPLMIVSLYSERANHYGAFAGILMGGLVAGVWPVVNEFIPFQVDPLIPGCLLSFLSIYSVSYLTKKLPALSEL